MEVARIQFEGMSLGELTNYQNYLQDHLDEVHHQIQLQDDHPPPDQLEPNQPYSDEENYQDINLHGTYITDNPNEICHMPCGVQYQHTLGECPEQDYEEDDHPQALHHYDAYPEDYPQDGYREPEYDYDWAHPDDYYDGYETDYDERYQEDHESYHPYEDY